MHQIRIPGVCPVVSQVELDTVAFVLCVTTHGRRTAAPASWDARRNISLWEIFFKRSRNFL